VTIDIALLFGAFAGIFFVGWITDHVAAADNQFVDSAQTALLVILPYLLLRVVADFMTVSAKLQQGAALALAVLLISIAASGSELPSWLVIGIGIYFVGLGMYASWEFARGARRARGVTARRLYAAASGSVFVGLVILIAVIRSLAPSLDSVGTDIAVRAMTLFAGLSYFLAFSPPRLLRRAWQEPELRDLLARVAVLPRRPDMITIVRELEDGAAATLGAAQASIGLWDAERQTIRFERDGQSSEIHSGERIVGRVFATQQAIFSENAPRDDPDYAADYLMYGAVAVLAAPITAGTRELGVLTVFTPRAPIFAEDDLQLV